MTTPATIVVKLSPAESATLRNSLEAEAGFSPHRNPSAAWSFRGEGVVVSAWTSGKCMVQGPGAAGFAELRLSGLSPASRETGSSKSKAKAGSGALEPLLTDLIGTDESGKGDYFGPLVTAAVLVPKGQERVLFELGVRDSKLLSDSGAKEAARLIRAAYPHHVVSISPEKYNELYASFENLNALLAWATAAAVKGVVAEHPCGHVLSDKFGNVRYLIAAFKKAGLDVDLVQRVRAEQNVAVAAASILARERFLSELSRLSTVSGVKLPKGAGSPVLVTGKRVFREGGREALRRVAKLHFKTTQQVSGLF